MTTEMEKKDLVVRDKRVSHCSSCSTQADPAHSVLTIRFFKAFGIEPKRNQQTTSGLSGIPLPDFYPEITTRILLELIVLLSKIMILKYHKFHNINELKENILTKCIYYNEDIYTRVRKLFGVE